MSKKSFSPGSGFLFYAIAEGPAYWHSIIVGVIKVPVEKVVLFCTKLILFPVPPFIKEPFLREAWQVEKNTSPVVRHIT